MSSILIRRANMVAGGSQPPAPSYITDGLIFHLDGIDKGSTSDTWTELISGTVIQGTNVVSTPYGWSFNGSAYFTSSYAPSGSENHTLEICFKPSNTGTYAVFASNSNTTNNLIFYHNSSHVITWLQRRNTYTHTLSANTPYSISLNLDRGIFNGTEVTKNSGTDYWNNKNLWIGRRNDGNYFIGEVYSIRIYNRRLTASEQLNNFDIDNSRFNLGI